MTVSIQMVLIIIGCTLVTVIPRISPFFFVKKLALPDVVLKWLSFIPVCILTALLVQNVIGFNEQTFQIDWTILVVLLPTTLTAIFTKSLPATVIIGVASMAFVRLFFT